MKKITPLLFLSFVLLIPFISFAQFVPLSAPCSLEPIPASPDGYSGPSSICPFCPSLGTSTKIHLKWDLKGSFKDPVCVLGCWNIRGESCPGWDAYHFVDEKGNLKKDLKPKDDIFLNQAQAYSNIFPTGPGTNMQVECWEKTHPATNKLSAGIRLVTDCSGIVGGCQERKFADIIGDLYNNQPSIITEKNLRGWSSYDGLDKAEKGGSGSIADVMNNVVDKQNTSISDINEAVFAQDGGVQNANKVLDTLKDATTKRNATPLFMVILAKDKTVATSTYDKVGLHVAISLGITSHSANYDKFDLKLLDSNYLANQNGHISTMSCNAVYDHVSFATNSSGALIFEQRPFYVIKKFYRCSYSAPPDPSGKFDDLEFAALLMKYSSIDVGPMISSAVRQNTADYLSSSDNNLTFDNFATEPLDFIDIRHSNGGVCAGWVDFTLRNAYLGKFQTIDCHPNGTFSQLKDSSNFLAQVTLPFKNLLEMMGFPGIDKN